VHVHGMFHLFCSALNSLPAGFNARTVPKFLTTAELS
jgi:hypothetical protein